MPLLPPEQLRADRAKSCSRKLVAGRTKIRIDSKYLVQNHDDRPCLLSRERLVRIKAALG